jgi:hypothetical protein
MKSNILYMRNQIFYEYTILIGAQILGFQNFKIRVL